MDRKTALDKIAKCLALSKSPNEAEAAAALRQAQKLMIKFDVTERDLGTVGIGEKRIQMPLQCGKAKVLPGWVSALGWCIAKAFGVAPMFGTSLRRGDWSWDAVYVGPLGRVEIACYAHQVLYRAAMKGWDRHLLVSGRDSMPRGARASYLIGFVQAVRMQVSAYEVTDTERKGIDAATNTGRDSLKSSNTKLNMDALIAGASAGSDFRLHTPLEANQEKKLLA